MSKIKNLMMAFTIAAAALAAGSGLAQTDYGTEAAKTFRQDNGSFFDSRVSLDAWSDMNPQTVKDSSLPLAEARPWCFWYWMNGNITREGIIADLQAFADVGVGGVFLFDIGLHPAGPVVNRSREWYDLVKLAAVEAQKRNIKVSFHCPGWTASGGPWITPELAMQELTWNETVVEGPRESTISLSQPRTQLNYYRDIAVIAFPTPELDEELPKPRLFDINGKLLPAGAASLPNQFDLVFPQPVKARSIFVRVARATGAFTAELSAFGESTGTFDRIAKFSSHPSGPFSANIGSATFTPIQANKFRLTFTGRKINAPVVIDQMELCGGYRVPDWTSKAGFAVDPVEPRPSALAPLPNDAIAMDKIIDLTGKFGSDGKLAWSAPAGRWTILRIGYTPTGVHISPAPAGGDGLECDKMSKSVADFHYDKCVTPVLREFGPELMKQTVAYYHVDSYEAGWQNWTSEFAREFSERRGYDLRKYLPAVTGRVVGDLATTEKFLWDFRRTIGDLYADNHYGQLAARCHKDGLGFSTEPYGGPFESIQTGTRADHPMTEFWLPGNPAGRKRTFHAVFAGHMAGRKIIGAESFTSEPPTEKWNSHPYSIKALGDFIWTTGVNRFVIHVSALQPMIGDHLRPGLTCGINGIHFDRGNTWWSQGKAWVQYLTRSQTLLQQGLHQADVLYFLGNDSPSSAGGPFQPALPEGYDFDACGGESLELLQVRDGQVMLPSGKSYRYLVLPGDGHMAAASLAKIAQLVRAGASVVGTRSAAESLSLADAPRAQEIQKLNKELWSDEPGKSGTRAVGKGRVIWGRSFEQILADDKLAADFDFDRDPSLSLRATHRRAGDTDIYFIANASSRAGWVNCTFRIDGKTPEFWYADTGRIVPAAVYEPGPNVTKVPLYFEPTGSMFVVFRPVRNKTFATGLTYAPLERSPGSGELRILEATYGPPGDSARRIDVTKQVAARVQNNRLNLRSFEALAGNPARNVRKELRIRYTLSGTTNTVSACDGQAIILPVPDGLLAGELRRDGDKLFLSARQAGRFTVKFAAGPDAVIDVPALAEPIIAAGPWELSFPPTWGAPEHVTLTNLISWPDHPDSGVRYFSGTATYRTALNIPPDRFATGQQVSLDLGNVQVIAEVKLNGHDLGILWKPPFIVDVTTSARPGVNELEVRVTNLWPNRLIGDEQYPDDCSSDGKWTAGGIHTWPDWLKNGRLRPEPRRLTFTVQKHWTKDDQLLPSGLLGPVRVLTSREVGVGINPNAIVDRLQFVEQKQKEMKK